MLNRSSAGLAVAVLLTLGFGAAANAATVDDLLREYAAAAKVESSTFKNFSADRGRAFYSKEHPAKGGATSCATCHTADPRRVGRTRANKDIKPMAPSANPDRFTNAAKVAKWFRRNCDDVLGRPCTALEKGDFITYVRSNP